jgi:transposase InsO family protein
MISTPHRRQAVTLIDTARNAGARLQPACEVIGISTRTHQRWTREGAVREDQRPLVKRPVPSNALCVEETQAILDACHCPANASLPPEQIVVRLMDEEALYLGSVSTFYRVLRRHALVAHRGRARAPKRHARPTTYHATSANQVWTWDCTWLPGPVKGTYYYLVLIIDIYSRKVVGWEVNLAESADNAQGVLERAMLAEQIHDEPLVLHADNGSSFKAATLLEKLRDLNIEPSFSRPRVSNDNPYSEALFRTCKYVPNYPQNGFATLEQARQWVLGFVRWYNQEHRHSAIRFVTPAQRHDGKDTAILAKRHRLNQAARAQHPNRWSGATRNWQPVGSVALNPAPEPQITPPKVAV